MTKLFERRLAPLDSPLAIFTTTTAAFLAAMLVTSFLFLSYGASPFQAYFALFHEPFATLRGFGYALVRASPLALIALGTIVSWRSGFTYLGFEGSFVIGAAATGWLALLTAPGSRHRSTSFTSIFTTRNFIGVRCGGHLGRSRRTRSRQAGRKRSIDFLDVELRRDIYFAISGVRSDESARQSSGNSIISSRHMATLYFAWNARTRGHFDRNHCRWFSLDAAAKNAARLRNDCDWIQSICSAICGHRCGAPVGAGCIFCWRTWGPRRNGGSTGGAAPADGWNQRRRRIRRNHCRPSRAIESARRDSNRVSIRRHVGGR